MRKLILHKVARTEVLLHPWLKKLYESMANNKVLEANGHGTI
jgi:hypothetical protein